MSETALAQGYAFEQLAPSVPASPASMAEALARASAEADEIRELARGEGHAEGRAAGYREGLAEASSAAHALGEALTGLHAVREETSAAVEKDAVELALALAEKILAGALQARPGLIADVIKGALRRISERHRVTVLVNPSDLEASRSALEDPSAQGGGLCEIHGDPSVPPGGAVVQTVEGELDASVHTQLERARELALAELERAA